jgi:prepilin-type N-terminal cleavage/methylation domain-containing protein
MTKQKGFSLIELLIVVAIILVIAALAIPSFMRAKIAANESSAAQSVRSINTAEVQYNTTYGLGYADLATIGSSSAGSCTATSTNACLVDEVLTKGIKSGYSFTVTPGGGTPAVSYTSIAVPLVIGQSGQRGFCSDQSQVIRFNWAGTCDPQKDSALQ